jgi:uncharacterized protein (TIGR04255 family)
MLYSGCGYEGVFMGGSAEMLFEDLPRVKYDKDTLDNVVCQFRFPALLGIDVDPPVAFQKAIRDRFPNYVEGAMIRLEIPPQPSEDVALDVLRQTLPGGKNHEFSSADGAWKLNLTRTFLALTTVDYSRWETFLDWFSAPLAALEREYDPGFYTRIGLRYVNVIRRSSLGLDGRSWNDLIIPGLLGLLGSEVADGVVVQGLQSIQEIAVPGPTSAQCRLITRLVRALDDNELCFVIDADFFQDARTAPTEALDKLAFFNQSARNLFRGAITETLDQAMEPQPL